MDIRNPTTAQLRLLVQWKKYGPEGLEDPDNRRVRATSLELIPQLAVALGLPRSLHAELYVKRGQRLADAWSTDLRHQLHYRARRRSLVLHDCSAVVPWTAYQAHVVGQVCDGLTYVQCDQRNGRAAGNSAKAVEKVRIAHAFRTTAELIAQAHRRGWIPDDAEMDALDQIIIKDVPR